MVKIFSFQDGHIKKALDSPSPYLYCPIMMGLNLLRSPRHCETPLARVAYTETKIQASSHVVPLAHLASRHQLYQILSHHAQLTIP